MSVAALPTFSAGLVLSLSLIMAIGPQNAHVLRVGLLRQHLWLTVAVCALSDIALIALGVGGLAQLGALSPWVQRVMVLGGVLFLGLYGWRAFQRFLHPAVVSEAAQAGAAPAPTRHQAVRTALAFAWLNPHAWLDTAVLIGSASLAYGSGRAAFGMGAATGSVLWFALLGGAAFWLGRRLNSVQVWRALDGMVALMMWGTAAGLLYSLG